jgi:signal transduction histidine kinase
LFGKVEGTLELIDVNDVTTGALRALTTELRNHGVKVLVSPNPNLSSIRGHRGQLQEAVINLINNAIEAMAYVSDRRILQVKTEPGEDDTIVISVEDSGAGLDAKKKENLFDAFVTTKPHGTGLGLAISRMIVERHGGHLYGTPNKPRGAVFRITLPRNNLPQ